MVKHGLYIYFVNKKKYIYFSTVSKLLTDLNLPGAERPKNDFFSDIIKFNNVLSFFLEISFLSFSFLFRSKFQKYGETDKSSNLNSTKLRRLWNVNRGIILF